MASSVFVPQLLINEGELGEILRMINAAKSAESRIVGPLFGLWRNSLIQPVVQLVTGPGAKAKTSKRSFIPDINYHGKISKRLETDYGLLQIGLWFSGNLDRYPRFRQGKRKYGGNNPLIPHERQYVLMCVDCSQGNLEIEYRIIDRENDSCRVAHLTAADVLPGESGFRLLEPVLERINKGAKFPFNPNEEKQHFSAAMLQTNHDEPQAKHAPNAVTRTTSASFIPATFVPQSSQWYESDGGSSLLRSLVGKLKSVGVAVDMSRDFKTHDIQLEIDRKICLHFPADFPTAPMSLTWVDDPSRFTRNPNEICTLIMKRATDVLSCETVRTITVV